MSLIKKIPNHEIKQFVDISCNAYPAFNVNTLEEKEKLITRFTNIQDESPNSRIVGLYRDETLQGGMILYNYKINMLGEEIDACGVGMVAVDLLHKKEKIAKEMIHYFLEHYKNNYVNLAVLYPFRPDFYKHMGFGYGTKINQYRIKPSSFPNIESKYKLVYLTNENALDMFDCYQHVYKQKHGMIKASLIDFENIFKNPRVKVLGYREHNEIKGYMAFSFKTDKENFLINDIVIHKLVYKSKEAFLSFCAFLHSQNDQIRYVFVNTFDDNLEFLLLDPRNDTHTIIPHVYHESNIQGVGLMYRIINIAGIFNNLKNHNFNNSNCRLKLTITDDFIEDNNASFIIQFTNGLPEMVSEGYDVEIKMNISEFSSLMMGVIQFTQLYNYSLASISDIQYLDVINNLFKSAEKPICFTDF